MMMGPVGRAMDGHLTFCRHGLKLSVLSSRLRSSIRTVRAFAFHEKGNAQYCVQLEVGCVDTK